MSWNVITPVGANVLIKLHPRRETYGALELPDSYRKQPESADVLAVGPRAPHDLQPGDVVVVGKWNGVPLENPEWDPDVEPGTYMMASADMEKRGDKLPVAVHGHRYRPWIPDIYAKYVRDDGETVEQIAERTATDVPKARFSK